MLYFISPTTILTFAVATLLVCAGNAGAGQPALPGMPATAAFSDRNYTRMPIKKGGSGVVVSYQLQGIPEIGKPLLVNIRMFSTADAQVTVRADDGLQLQSPQFVMQSTAGIAGEHQLTVVPAAIGRFYVHVMSTANGRTSASAIAVQVGADKDMPQAKPSGAIKIMPNGERVISMPAQ